METFQLVTLDHKKVATRIRVPNTRLLIQGFHWIFHNVDPIIRIYIFDEIRILWLLLLADRSLVYWLPAVQEVNFNRKLANSFSNLVSNKNVKTNEPNKTSRESRLWI